MYGSRQLSQLRVMGKSAPGAGHSLPSGQPGGRYMLFFFWIAGAEAGMPSGKRVGSPMISQVHGDDAAGVQHVRPCLPAQGRGNGRRPGERTSHRAN